MQDLCLNYPHGLGAFCSGENVRFREPRNPLYFQGLEAGAGISSLCRRLCRCYDIAPDIPSIENEPAVKEMADCGGDEEEIPSSPNESSIPQARETAQCPNGHNSTSETKHPGQFKCDAFFYGHPESTDCEAAIKKLPDWADATHAIREYFELDDLSTNSDFHLAQDIQFNDGPIFYFRDKVKAPVVTSNGACKVAVLLPDSSRQSAQRTLVGSQALINAAEDLQAECVDRLGSGGKFDHLWLMDGNILIPNIVIFERNSHMDDWLTLKTTKLITSSENPMGSLQKGCSGTCMNPKDCDINSDCVCATDKPLPLSSTWGHHACMYIAGAALAHMQAATIEPYTHCRGRCLSEDSGTSNSTGAANITNHGILKYNTSFTNRTILSSNNFSSPPIPYSYHSEALPLTNNSVYSYKAPTHLRATLTGSSNNTDPQPIPPATSLTCPCNCTYVSASCCLSPYVWEDTSKRLQMAPLPANGTVCCNGTSGEWVPKSSLADDCAAIV